MGFAAVRVLIGLALAVPIHGNPFACGFNVLLVPQCLNVDKAWVEPCSDFESLVLNCSINDSITFDLPMCAEAQGRKVCCSSQSFDDCKTYNFTGAFIAVLLGL